MKKNVEILWNLPSWWEFLISHEISYCSVHYLFMGAPHWLDSTRTPGPSLHKKQFQAYKLTASMWHCRTFIQPCVHCTVASVQPADSLPKNCVAGNQTWHSRKNADENRKTKSETGWWVIYLNFTQISPQNFSEICRPGCEIWEVKFAGRQREILSLANFRPTYGRRPNASRRGPPSQGGAHTRTRNNGRT